MAGVLDTIEALRVYTKASWEDSWVQQDGIIPKSISLGLSSTGFGKFEFDWHFGQVKLATETSFTTRNPRTYHRDQAYIQVRIKGTTGTDYEEVDANIFWQGRAATCTTALFNNGSGGVQHFTAYDGLYILYKTMFSDSIIDVSEDPSSSFFAVKNKIPPINLIGSSGKLISNRSRSAQTGGLNPYAYEGNRLDEDADLGTTEVTARTCLSDLTLQKTLSIRLTGAALSELEKIERHYPLPQVVRALDVLKLLINRKDGFDFYAVPFTPASPLRGGWFIDVYSINDSAITTAHTTDLQRSLEAL
jgi:hypothetical protein